MSVNWGNEEILPFNKREKSTRVGERAKTNVVNVPLDPVTSPASDMLYVTYSNQIYPVEVKSSSSARITGGTHKHRNEKQ